jgi:hypothetical protein
MLINIQYCKILCLVEWLIVTDVSVNHSSSIMRVKRLKSGSSNSLFGPKDGMTFTLVGVQPITSSIYKDMKYQI